MNTRPAGRISSIESRLDDFWFFAWDARGHGRSPGDRGYAESFGRMVRDAEEFVRHLSQQFDIPIENMAVVAQSVGAVLATTWVHDYAPPIRGLAIATPALRVKLYVPLAIPASARASQIQTEVVHSQLCQAEDAHARSASNRPTTRLTR